jgi:hypothetical protein
MNTTKAGYRINSATLNDSTSAFMATSFLLMVKGNYFDELYETKLNPGKKITLAEYHH